MESHQRALQSSLISKFSHLSCIKNTTIIVTDHKSTPSLQRPSNPEPNIVSGVDECQGMRVWRRAKGETAEGKIGSQGNFGMRIPIL